MFADLIQQVTRVIQHYEGRGERPSEEATKHALVLPFIHDVLGAHYPLNPEEVIPEFTADISERKGEKVDYAICRDGEPVILIECKALDTSLDDKAVQLKRYIGALSQVSLGILTDGRRYRFFADLDALNIMDSEPFFRTDLLKLNPVDKKRLQLFHLNRLNVDTIKEEGRGWKAVASLVQALESEWNEPSDGYITHFARPLHQKGSLTESVRRQYANYLKEAHQIFLGRQTDPPPPPPPPPDEWQPLTELDPTKLQPQRIQFEDGSTTEVKNWSDLFRTVARKLASEGHLLPVPDDLRKIIKQNPPGTKTPWIKLPDGQYIRNHGSATDRLNITMRLLTASKYDPAKCVVQ